MAVLCQRLIINAHGGRIKVEIRREIAYNSDIV